MPDRRLGHPARLYCFETVNLIATHYTPEQTEARHDSVRRRMLRDSIRVREGNFHSICDRDIQILFRLYDEVFFHGELGAEVLQRTGVPLTLHASGAMTRLGGKTTQFRQRTNAGIKTRYEIAISGRLLLSSFAGEGRPVMVSGLSCRDRLDAMQRIMEHELVHLAEWLTFGTSSCAKTRFMTLAQRIFGHRQRYHQLVTPHEHAATKFSLKIGDPVAFSFQGQAMRGFINRIGVRATILVEQAQGTRYSDGHHYAKYYVPVSHLKKQREEIDQ